MKCRGCVGVTILALLQGVLVFAADSDKKAFVSMTFADCERVSTSEVERIFGMELRTIANGRTDVSAQPSTVRVRCGTSNIHLEIDSEKGTTRKQIAVTTRNDEDPERLIALAAAELVLLSWVDSKDEDRPPSKSSSPKSAPPKASQTAKQSTSDRSVKRAHLFSFDFSASYRIYFQGESSLFGGELSLLFHPIKPLFLRTAVAFEGGRATRRLGEVSLFSASGVFAVGLEKALLSYLSVRIETGIRTGYGRLKGRPNADAAKSGTLSGSFGGPMLCIGLASRTRPSVGISVESGYAAFGVQGNVGIGDTVELQRFWLGVGIGVGF